MCDQTDFQWEPRVGTPARVEWQQRKNAEALALVDALCFAPAPKDANDAST